MIAWGGPGPSGRQQVYLTTISRSGKPGSDPVVLSEGPSDALGMRLVGRAGGALLGYCTGGAGGNELHRLQISGSPPSATEPALVGQSAYIPCMVDHVPAGEGSLVLWADREEDAGGVLEDGIAGQLLDARGSPVGQGFSVPGVRLVKYPGKHHRPFHALPVEAGRMALAWIQRKHDGSVELHVGLFDATGRPEGGRLEVHGVTEPTDPHLAHAGKPGTLVLAWLDRPVGSQIHRVHVALLEIDGAR